MSQKCASRISPGSRDRHCQSASPKRARLYMIRSVKTTINASHYASRPISHAFTSICLRLILEFLPRRPFLSRAMLAGFRSRLTRKTARYVDAFCRDRCRIYGLRDTDIIGRRKNGHEPRRAGLASGCDCGRHFYRRDDSAMRTRAKSAGYIIAAAKSFAGRCLRSADKMPSSRKDASHAACARHDEELPSNGRIAAQALSGAAGLARRIRGLLMRQ